MRTKTVQVTYSGDLLYSKQTDDNPTSLKNYGRRDLKPESAHRNRIGTHGIGTKFNYWYMGTMNITKAGLNRFLLLLRASKAFQPSYVFLPVTRNRTPLKYRDVFEYKTRTIYKHRVLSYHFKPYIFAHPPISCPNYCINLDFSSTYKLSLKNIVAGV